MTNRYRLRVNVQIINAEFSSAGLSINEEMPISLDTFKQMAEILEAFHVLVEQYREQSDAPKR